MNVKWLLPMAGLKLIALSIVFREDIMLSAETRRLNHSFHTTVRKILFLILFMNSTTFAAVRIDLKQYSSTSQKEFPFPPLR